jgi:hypothetical protein
VNGRSQRWRRRRRFDRVRVPAISPEVARLSGRAISFAKSNTSARDRRRSDDMLD